MPSLLLVQIIVIFCISDSFVITLLDAGSSKCSSLPLDTKEKVGSHFTSCFKMPCFYQVLKSVMSDAITSGQF